MPSHLTLNFERGAELGAALRKEVAEHRWEVAGADAYPWLVAVDADVVARPPTAKEVTIAEAIALALPGVLKEKKALLAAWNGGETVSRTLPVSTHAGVVEVSLRAPHEQCREEPPPYDVLTDLFELRQDGEAIDPEESRSLEDEVVRRFAASPEAKGSTDIQACRSVMDFAADYFGATIATLGPRDLRQDRPQRAVPLRLGQEVEEVLRSRMKQRNRREPRARLVVRLPVPAVGPGRSPEPASRRSR